MLEKIEQKINPKYRKQAEARWNAIAKPIHSLGLLEDAIIKIAGIQENAADIRIEKAALVILCGDHGVVKEKVTQTGQEVTRIVAENFTTGAASAVAMARVAQTDVFPVDIGIASDKAAASRIRESVTLQKDSLTLRNIRKGTGNIAIEPAMTREECEKAIQTGIDIVGELKEMGYHLIATGEMGIGNTTPSSALAAVLLEESVEGVTGKGAGLSNAGLEQKCRTIKNAIHRYEMEKETEETETDYIQLMAELGGLELAGMMGLFLGGAVHRVPILIDGFISAVSALMAVRLAPDVKQFILASHVSKEPAGKRVLEALGLSPFLTAEMCLGEGTGAVATIPILRMALAVYQEMSTFQDISIDAYEKFQD